MNTLETIEILANFKMELLKKDEQIKQLQETIRMQAEDLHKVKSEREESESNYKNLRTAWDVECKARDQLKTDNIKLSEALKESVNALTKEGDENQELRKQIDELNKCERFTLMCEGCVNLSVSCENCHQLSRYEAKQ